MTARLDTLIHERWELVGEWLEGHRKRLRMPVYTSVDLRNSNHKIVPVDANLYPSGFNNLCSRDGKCAVSFKSYISSTYGDARNILVIAETHTRNKYYIDNLKSLLAILKSDGYDAGAGIVSADMWKDSIEMDGTNGPLSLGRVYREGDALRTPDLKPDLIISNNDFSDGIPDFFKGKRQPIDPPPELGWVMRRKNLHFDILEKLMGELASILDVDRWFIYPATKVVHNVDFRTTEGFDRIARTISDVIEDIRAKYREYTVEDEPFVFIKSNYGTYGLACTTATSSDQFLENIKKEKKKMQKGKGGVEVREVIVQEGIPTALTHSDCPLEPVIYMIGGIPVGGFYRINCERNTRQNLNTPGMTFSPICFQKLSDEKPAFLDSAAGSEQSIVRTWGVIASVAAIAAALEMNAHNLKQDL